MVEIGKMNVLAVLRSSPHGLFLDGDNLGDILLPKRYVSRALKPGDEIEVFLMFDSEDRLIATTQRPLAMVGDFAWLRVVSSTGAGTFLDWGLAKDLLVPFREQTVKMLPGRSYMVRIYLDQVSNRIAATARLDRFLDKKAVDFVVGQAVDLLICARTDLGYKAIVDGTHWGMIFHKNIFRSISCGQRMPGYIQQVREDGKIGICLDPPGHGRISDVADMILAYLDEQGGFMPVTDKTAPEQIHALFGISKKAYKQAIGALYKARRITFEEGGTRRLESSRPEILKTLHAAHPRLLADSGRFEKIGKLVQADSHARSGFETVTRDAEAILREAVIAYDIPDGKRLLAVSRRLVDRIFTLGLVWQVTHEPRYLDRALQELSAAAEFPDWNPSHFLDTAEMTAGMAIGYDWFHDGLGEPQRAMIRNAIITKGLNEGIKSYEGTARYGWWVGAINNWNLVCNGGMIAGALAIAEEEPQLAARIVAHAVQSLPHALQNFGPDGGWFEGPGYWGYAMKYSALAIACLDSALGDDFGLSRIEGFDRAAEFYIQMAGATGKSFNYADANSSTVQHPSLFWLAGKFNRPDWASYQLYYGGLNAESLLWYEPGMIASEVVALPAVAYFCGVEVASARTSGAGDQGLYIGVKAGRNGVNHDNLDLGSFVFEALGERWIIDLGPDDYNLPQYFGENRYTYYRMRAEGHNTLVINPERRQPDQDPAAFCTIATAKTEGHVSSIETDLTAAYAGHGAIRVHRTFVLAENSLTLTDIVELEDPGSVWWFFHTPANVTLSDDGRSAVLAIGTQRLLARLEAPGSAQWKIMNARPLPTSPDPAGQNPNNGARLLNATSEFRIVKVGDTPLWGDPDPAGAICKLAIHVTDISSVDVRVVFCLDR